MGDELIWNDAFLVGIEEVDLQHKEIIDAVNALCDAVKENIDSDEIIKLIEKMDFYIEFHFETEENYMKAYNYEGFVEHKKAHKFFRDVYNQIRYSYFYVDNQQIPRKEVLNVYALLLAESFKSWLIYHLKTYDKKFGLFLKKIFEQHNNEECL